MANGKGFLDRIWNDVYKLCGLAIFAYLIYMDIQMDKDVPLVLYIPPAIMMQLKPHRDVVEAIKKIRS